MSAATDDRLALVRLLLLDVDGVLTDGRLRYGPGGDEGRDFHVRDGTALRLLQEAGVPVGIVSGRRTQATERWARDIGLAEVHQGQRPKLPAWTEILARRGLVDGDVAYMGDDVLDLPLLERAGLACAPADACAEAREAATWISRYPGGHGCVRELAEAILRARGRWDGLVRRGQALTREAGAEGRPAEARGAAAPDGGRSAPRGAVERRR